MRTLHLVYSALVRSDLVPPSFSQAWLALIPKAPIARDVTHVASPSHLRPPTLSGNCQHLVVRALCAPLGAIAWLVVHEPQRGIVRSRQMASNFDGRMWLLRSSCWTYMRRFPASNGLGRSGSCTRWACRNGSLTPVSPHHGSEVEGSLHAQRSGVKRRIMHRITQGCPPSGCIWVWAHDLVIRCLWRAGLWTFYHRRCSPTACLYCVRRVSAHIAGRLLSHVRACRGRARFAHHTGMLAPSRYELGGP